MHKIVFVLSLLLGVNLMAQGVKKPEGWNIGLSKDSRQALIDWSQDNQSLLDRAGRTKNEICRTAQGKVLLETQAFDELNTFALHFEGEDELVQISEALIKRAGPFVIIGIVTLDRQRSVFCRL